MRPYAEAFAGSLDRPAFSNSTEGYAWMDNWCSRCIHDAAYQRDAALEGCPLIVVSMEQRTPAEWIEQDSANLGEQYLCIEFRDEDDGPGPEPQPIPDPPDMDELIPREPYTAPLMFTANVQREPVSA